MANTVGSTVVFIAVWLLIRTYQQGISPSRWLYSVSLKSNRSKTEASILFYVLRLGAWLVLVNPVRFFVFRFSEWLSSSQIHILLLDIFWLLLLLFGSLAVLWSYRKMVLETYYQYGERPKFGYWFLSTPILGDIIWWVNMSNWKHSRDLPTRYQTYQLQVKYGKYPFVNTIWVLYLLSLLPLIVQAFMIGSEGAFLILVFSGFIGALFVALFMAAPSMVYVVMVLSLLSMFFLSGNRDFNTPILYSLSIGLLTTFFIHLLFFPGKIDPTPLPDEADKESLSANTPTEDLPDILDSGF
ncbi:MAG: hypothetical protein R2795_24465 [Saprospiraceae bacterium]